MPDTERIPSGHKILMPDSMALATLSMKRPGDEGISFMPTIDQEALTGLLNEHAAIKALLIDLVGRRNVIIARTSMISDTHGDGISVARTAPIDVLPDSRNVPFLEQSYGVCWPRDAFSVINGQILINRRLWTYADGLVRPSSFGDGGKVLPWKQTILVSKDIWDAQKRAEIVDLRNQGLKVGFLPRVDPDKQEWDFNWEQNHIDGHNSLIEDRNGGMNLLVAKSYFDQSKDTRKGLEYSTDSVGAKLWVVDDEHLPPLAFNLEQFLDGTVAMTKGAQALEQVVTELVGPEKVRTTSTQLWYIPGEGQGGIRCITNILPPLPQAYWQC